MIMNKRMLAALLAAPAALTFAAPVQAQVSGSVATINPIAVVARSKAYIAAQQQIQATYKSAFDQIQARQTRFQTEVKPLIGTIDTNKDGDISEQEDAAAAARKDPNYARVAQLQQTANTDLQNLQLPVLKADIYAIEKILDLYDASQQRVVTARKVGVIVAPSAVLWAPDGIDITDAVLAEVDKTPSVAIAPPADWRPQQRAVELQQQLSEIKRRQAYAAAQQQQGARPATAPATGARPAPGIPAKPPEPR